MLSPRGAALILAAVALLLAAGNAYETLRRSMLPLALDGRVESEEVRREKHPGIDDVHLLAIDGETVHVDEPVAGLVTEGDELRKEAWSSTLIIDGTGHDLKLSSDATGMFVVMPLVLVVLPALVLTRGRSPAPGSTRPART